MLRPALRRLRTLVLGEGTSSSVTEVEGTSSPCSAKAVAEASVNVVDVAEVEGCCRGSLKSMMSLRLCSCAPAKLLGPRTGFKPWCPL